MFGPLRLIGHIVIKHFDRPHGIREVPTLFVSHFFGQLLLQYGFDPAQPVAAAFTDAFSAGPALIRYQRDKRGKPHQFIVDSSRARNYVFERVAVDRGERCSE